MIYSWFSVYIYPEKLPFSSIIKLIYNKIYIIMIYRYYLFILNGIFPLIILALNFYYYY